MTPEQEIQAVIRLSFARKSHDELARVEARARLVLASAIIAMDEAADREEHGIHDLQEQADVEVALRAYGDALANLVRGEE